MGNSGSTVRKIENGRAAYAFEQVDQFVRKNREDTVKEYRSYLKKMPAMIQVNGFGQAMAFAYAKGGEAYTAIYQQISEWLRERHGSLLRKVDSSGQQELVQVIVNMDSSDYRVLSTEALALLQWMSRFVDGMVR